MSNIKNYYFNNLDMILTNSDYWDLFLCYDERLTASNSCDGILTGSSLVSQFDFNDPRCISGNTIYSLVCWNGSVLPYSGLSLCDIGLTGVDNGFVQNLTGETLTVSSGDCRLYLTRVSGLTYSYDWSVQSGSTGQYISLCGGFFQGFWKLQGFDYQVLPKRMDWGWSSEFWLKKTDIDCYNGLTVNNATATTYNFITSFNEETIGAYPNSEMINGNNGKLYGFTGGDISAGTIYSYTISSNTTDVIYHFNDEGLYPADTPTLIDGKLYGTTSNGGLSNYGTIFSFELSSNTYNTLYSFSGPPDGKYPAGKLLLGSNGFLYGTTPYGGSSNYGAIFSFELSSNTCNIIHSFSGGPGTFGGNLPREHLIEVNSRLYGTLQYGDNSEPNPQFGGFYYFEISSNTYSILLTFSGTPNLMYPYGNLFQIGDDIYGIGSAGGPYDNGGGGWEYNVITHTYEEVYYFQGLQFYPFGATYNSNGLIYGLSNKTGTEDKGVVFSLNLDTQEYNVIHSFSGSPYDAGDAISGGLLQVDNFLYGITSNGGLDNAGAMFSVELSASSIVKNTILNDLYPNNKGFFFYLGARAENKFWNLFSGETGYTTCISGFTLTPDPYIVDPADSVNSFLRNNGGCNPYKSSCSCTTSVSGCCNPCGCTCECHSSSAVTLYNKSSENDIINNNIGLRIKDDGSIGYRLIAYSSKCESCCTKLTGFTNTGSITGVSIVEGYSMSGVVRDDVWTHVVVVFKRNCPDPCFDNDLYPPNSKCNKGRLMFFVNGYLVYIVHEFEEVLFKDFSDEIIYKIESLPYSISIGGGSQGLLESQTFGGPDPDDKQLLIERYFAGTFIGSIQEFRFYQVPLDILQIRCNYNSQKDIYQ